MVYFILLYLVLFILGASLASFLGVYTSRLLKGESIVTPRSHCPRCNHVLKWYELIPVVSYLILKGKCSRCSKEIGVSSLITELVCGLLFMIIFYIFGFSYNTLIGYIIILLLISISLTDFKEMIILDSTLVIGVILIYLVTYLDSGLRGIYLSFLYGVFAFVCMFLVKILGDAAFKRESLGGGDIKLAFLMGSILPYNLFLLSLVIGSTSALPYALYINKKNTNGELAFGPFLVIGLLLVYTFSGFFQGLLDYLLIV